MSESLKFDYQSKRDRDPQSKQTMLFLRLGGLVFVLTGGVSMWLTWDNLFTYKLFLYPLQIAFGLFQFIYPQLSARGFSLTNKTVSIDDQSISWKLSARKPMQSIKISSINKINVYFGEVHFEMNSGENLILKKHEIRNKTKFEKFNQLIEEMQKD